MDRGSVSRKGRLRLSWTFALACLTACMSAQTVMIHEGPGGAVYLEDPRKGPLDATHPISLGPATLGRVLEGILVQKDTRMLQQLMPGEAKREPAFSPGEIAFLTPLLHEALSRATPAQVVRFQVVRTPPSGNETTGGALYVKSQSLYVTLTQYRVRPSKSYTAIKSDRVRQDATGLRDRTVLFVQKGVTRTDLHATPGVVGPPHLTTLVLDYRLLDKLAGLEREPPRAERAGSTRQPPAAGEPSLEERITQQERELDALKEELRSLQHDRGDGAPSGQPPAP